jgi:uncharacterized protein YkwD
MKTYLIIAFIFQFLSSGIAQTSSPIQLSKDETALYDLIMKYRKSKNLPVIPLSKSLTYVAYQHVDDITKYPPDLNKGCNPHSWSDKGKWSACCYTNDHSQSKCMWNKPRELTSYKDNGYEILHYSTQLSPNESLEAWKKSQGHHQVIINDGIWKKAEWKAIGICMKNGYACVWFGKSEDTDK